jgi:hypothetical protein
VFFFLVFRACGQPGVPVEGKGITGRNITTDRTRQFYENRDHIVHSHAIAVLENNLENNGQRDHLENNLLERILL